ncbi:MAG: sodium/glutamate symporter [Helicobacter sp.]|nr:sodium/glutamate symporter [Helicobacter sp.]
MSTIQFDFYTTFVSVVIVLIIGQFLVKRVAFFRNYSIPEPVVGGIFIAILLFFGTFFFDIKFKFDTGFREPLMLAFFSTIGLSANFGLFKQGGSKLVIFLICAVGILILQDVLGVALALIMGVPPVMGLLAGSVTMTGGHGTGLAWASVFEKAPFLFTSAKEVAVAAATFGLIAGSIVGGPVAKYLIKRHNLKTPGLSSDLPKDDHFIDFEEPKKQKLITTESFIKSLALVAICLFLGTFLNAEFKKYVPGWTLPTFVWCLVVGVILRNIFDRTKIHAVFDREVSVIGNVALSLFVAAALMTINFVDLVKLALPMLVILSLQVVLIVLFAMFVTFRLCGKNYDASVLAAGHCGFGLGATPNAMVNMQAVTSKYGNSHIAFVIVPLTGAFFIDIANSIVLNFFVSLPIF